MKHPLLYQLNTRVLLGELGRSLGRPATLNDFSDAFIAQIAARGFEWVWPLGVWQTGPAGREISRTRPSLRDGYAHDLPDWRDDDVVGSPFAIQAYAVNRDFGGDAALARFRERLARQGLKLLCDFVPNHVAPDHPWVAAHPEFFIEGTDEDLAREPQNWGRFAVGRGTRVLAFGRDPYFPGWPDAVQLNYRSGGLREAMVGELGRVSERCDAVRCDMAMLVQPEIFLRTWGDKAKPRDGSPPQDTPFWSDAIARIKRRRPEFMFVAEVYWDMEWELQQAGFDYTYDKRLYDRLEARQARAVREHLMAAPDFQNHSLRFLENHDEPRAAAAFQPAERHMAAAVITFLVPGLRFFYEGELEGRRARASMHLGRRVPEARDEGIAAFYEKLLGVLRRPEVHEGRWRQLTPRQAWDGNGTFDNFVAGLWEDGDTRLMTVANYGDTQGQCYLTIDVPALAGRRVVLADVLGDARYERDGREISTVGLYLDLPAWGRHVFEVRLA
jgi:glycosidase